MSNPKNDRQKKRNSRKSNNQEDNSWIDPDQVVGKAQRIVNSAVNVLEEEIAAGILAAKKIEKKLIDVDEIRSDPDALMNRIRHDSHEVLDLFIDAFSSITGQLNGVIEALKKETDQQAKANKKTTSKNTSATSEVILLEPDQPLKPGESIKLTLSLHEDGKGKLELVELRKSDLVGPGNQRIGLRAIKIEPKKLSLNGKQEKDITVTLKLPKNSQPGRYNTLLTDVNNPLIRILVTVEVIE